MTAIHPFPASSNHGRIHGCQPHSGQAHSLPNWFPTEAALMNDAGFAAAYAPAGRYRLHQLSVEAGADDLVTCRAMISDAGHELDLQARATGPIGAMTEILYDLNAGVEIVSLHQQREGDGIATYLLCERDGRRCWAFGRATTGDEATARALVAGANQLCAPRAL